MTKRASKSDRPILAITMGDPAGIGPEIIVKALAKPAIWRVCRPIVIGSVPVMQCTVKALKSPLAVVALNGHGQPLSRMSSSRGRLVVLDPFSQPIGRFRMGEAASSSGAASVECIKTAVRLAENRAVGGIVTAPINKKAIHLGGYSYPGHTELLAHLTRSKKVGMMILGGPLKILFVTTHVAIRDLPDALTPTRVGGAIRLAHWALQKYFHASRPRIAVAALNPHAGEEGLFGDEERRVIFPAVKRARMSGINVTDPLPADTLFGKAIRKEYDAIVAMYHDQGLIPLKMMAFGHCVNLTVGLPIIRTSVDHGTAYDIAGQGKADPQSLIEAITLAARLTTVRKTSDVGG